MTLRGNWNSVCMAKQKQATVQKRKERTWWHKQSSHWVVGQGRTGNWRFERLRGDIHSTSGVISNFPCLFFWVGQINNVSFLIIIFLVRLCTAALFPLLLTSGPLSCLCFTSLIANHTHCDKSVSPLCVKSEKAPYLAPTITSHSNSLTSPFRHSDV